ncbi:hypothetical protein EXS73_00845 [Candidatus Pacearchaeota archaeon]|nr:hypothetical protein [Candidatus Pacearchaeota archaeon]
MGLNARTLYSLSALIIFISLVLYIIVAGFSALFSFPLDLEDSIFFIMKVSLILGISTECVKWLKQKDSKKAVTLSWLVIVIGAIANISIASSLMGGLQGFNNLGTVTFSFLAVGLISLISFIVNLFD